MPRAIGSLTTTSASEVALDATTFTEVLDNVLRGIKSSSANDTAAGTGARTVRITFYKLAADGSITGPFAEVVTLNGTTAVPTVNTMTFVERMEVVTAGSGLVAAGTISLFPVAAGTGTAIAILAAAAVRTFLARHYVASNRQCVLRDIECIGGDAAAALVDVKVLPYVTGPAAGIETSLTGPFGSTLTTPRNVRIDDLVIAGPCRVRLTVTPANTNSQTTRASFGWADTRTGA